MSEHTALPEDHVPTPEETRAELLGDEEPGNDAALEVIEPESEPVTATDLGLDLPDDPAQAASRLLTAVAEARSEAGEYLDTLQRVAAEFDNYRKRTERDYADTVQRATQRLIEQLLPTLDSFDAALAYEAASEGESSILAGMRSTHGLLMETLAREGFAPIAADGVPFDPAVHEAVSGPSEEGDGELVVQEMRRGYTLRGRVIRPALVTVEHT
ncbi:MAG: nucleotide exchange factor GrpE [Acidimicrobiia bacterium]|jgi:molecular chaperone GrpE